MWFYKPAIKMVTSDVRTSPEETLILFFKDLLRLTSQGPNT